MVNAFSPTGAISFALLLICTCAYLRRVPKIRAFLFTNKKSYFGLFHKASLVGIRLHLLVAVSCVFMAIVNLLTLSVGKRGVKG